MIRWTKDGKVVFSKWYSARELADALEVAVSALKQITTTSHPSYSPRIAIDALRKIGVEQ